MMFSAGCCNCAKPPTNCGTSVTVHLADLAGRTGQAARFYPPLLDRFAPTAIRYSVTANGGAASAGTVDAQWLDAVGGYAFTVPLGTGAGTYSVRVWSESNNCFAYTGSTVFGRQYGVDGRFDATFSVQSTCPDHSTHSDVTVQATCDFITWGVACAIRGCLQGDAPAQTCYGDDIRVVVTPSASGGATICQTHPISYQDQYLSPSGFDLRVTSYPFTLAVGFSAANCFADATSITFNGPSDVSDSNPLPAVTYKYWPIVAIDALSQAPIDGATVTVTGRFSGAGRTIAGPHVGGCGTNITGTTFTPYGRITLDGVDDSAPDFQWTVSAPGYKSRTYSYNDLGLYNATHQDPYPGTFCPMGGQIAPDDGHGSDWPGPDPTNPSPTNPDPITVGPTPPIDPWPPINPYPPYVTPYSVAANAAPQARFALMTPVQRDIADQLQRGDEVHSCPHRTPPPCGCAAVAGRCALGKFADRGGPTWADCLACRQGDGVRMVGHMNSHTGYGQHITDMARALEALGVPVLFEPIDTSDAFIPLDQFAAQRLIRPRPRRGA